MCTLWYMPDSVMMQRLIAKGWDTSSPHAVIAVKASRAQTFMPVLAQCSGKHDSCSLLKAGSAAFSPSQPNDAPRRPAMELDAEVASVFGALLGKRQPEPTDPRKDRQSKFQNPGGKGPRPAPRKKEP